MTSINILSPHVADLIAAGEVVERPASVIKELVENAFDAGAKNVTVEIKNGGATFIRVTDDGRGMSPEDAGVAFLRHATSKLRDERGLEAIGTMGFRGEALAAISAVSHIELLTRERGAANGTRVTLAAGDIEDMDEFGCPEGTVMTVRDLFYNTPARLKFLKSDRAEGSACVLTALRCALGRPDISVKCIKDGKEEFFSPGDCRESSCVYALLGRDMAAGMLSCTGANECVKVTGFVSSPSVGRGNRAQQYFFCNGRFIKSAKLQAAVEQAYKNTLLTGRYPACALYITLSCGAVDVNVHPAKTEVKFSDEKKVFDAVYYAVLSALQGEDTTAQAQASPAAAPSWPPLTRELSAEPTKGEKKPSPISTEPRTPDAPLPASRPAGTPAVEKSAAPIRQPQAAYITAPSWHPVTRELSAEPTEGEKKTSPASAAPRTPAGVGVPDDPSPAFSHPVPAGTPIVEKPAAPALPDYKIIGEALDTYIIVQSGESVLLIDKHACHERIMFDRLKGQEREIMAQTLLIPVTVTPSGEDGEIIEKNGELLTALGFEVEPYGESAFVVRAVPADMDQGDVAPAIEEICEKLRKNPRLDPQGARDEILHTVACKAAIKAGWKTDPKELAVLAEAVLSGRVKYCPHGRPVSVTITKKELDKQFKRIV